MVVKVLVCVDGEPHSNRAMQQAISLGLSLPAEVTALHVINPWLKKFYNELYSQGRKQYLEYVDECLQAEAKQVHEKFDDMCLEEGLEAEFKVRHGEPLMEILDEVRERVPDLLITGSKPLNAWGRFRSANLPLRLKRMVGRHVSVLSVSGASLKSASQTVRCSRFESLQHFSNGHDKAG